MKRILLFFILATISTFAQVGIGTTRPSGENGHDSAVVANKSSYFIK